MIRAENALFSGEKHKPPTNPITTGIFNQIHNPMYLDILLLYFSFIVLTMSLIAFGAWIVIVIIYDRMVSFDEKILEEMFREEYKNYKKKTNKWIPG